MQPGVRAWMPTATVLGLFCRGCLSKTQSLHGHSFSCLPRQMSRWNSWESDKPPPSQENPRILITGNLNSLLSWVHKGYLLLTCIHSGKDGVFHTEPVMLPLFSTTFTVQPLFCTAGYRVDTMGWRSCLHSVKWNEARGSFNKMKLNVFTEHIDQSALQINYRIIIIIVIY